MTTDQDLADLLMSFFTQAIAAKAKADDSATPRDMAIYAAGAQHAFETAVEELRIVLENRTSDLRVTH